MSQSDIDPTLITPSQMESESTAPAAPLSDIQQVRANVEWLAQELQNQKNLLTILSETISNSIETAFARVMTSNQPKPKLPSIATPNPYDGTSGKAQSFLNSINLYIEGRESEFPTGSSKIIFAISYMKEGKAKTWVDNKMKKDGGITGLYPTWPSFVAAFKEDFFDPLEEHNARIEIRKLRQGTGSVKDYILAFEQYEDKTGYSDLPLREAFEEGLHPSIQRKVYNLRPMPETLAQWKNEARLLYMQQEKLDSKTKSSNHHTENKKPTSPSQSSSSSKPVVSQTNTGTGTTFGGSGQPMDIDAARRKGNCFRCGKHGHLARFCPDKPPIHVRKLDITGLTREEFDRFLKQWKDANEEKKDDEKKDF